MQLSTYSPAARAAGLAARAPRASHVRVAGVALRVALGLVILPHGLQKALGLFGGYGWAGTMGYFTGQLHIPYALGALAILAESLGALGLLAGLGGRVAAAGVAAVMATAALMQHRANGFFMNWSGQQAGEGYEYHVLAFVLALAVALRGSGAFSLDRVLARRLAGGAARAGAGAPRPAPRRAATAA